MKKRNLYFFFFVSAFAQNSYAQTLHFDLTDSIPVILNSDTLNNPWAGGINAPLFSEIDLNGDGIQDLFMFDRANNRISTFINDGSPGVKAWHYAPEYISKFPPINSWVLLYDYNCDGKADLFTLAPSTSGMTVYRNDFDTAQGGLRFTLVDSELIEIFPPSFHAPLFTSATAMPAFGDVDNDGDMDILCTNSLPDGKVIYHRNYSVEHGHGCDSLDFYWEDDNWGHFTVGINNSSIYAKAACFNCRPAPTIPNAHGLDDYDQSSAAARDDTYFDLFIIDLNGDGAKELLIGDGGALNSLMVMNGGTPDSAAIISQDTVFPGYNIPALFNNFHNHAYIDVDNDGIRDLLVEAAGFENFHDGVWFYKNTGTNSVPNFAYQSSSFLVDQMIDVGEGASPVLFDADGDGLQDLVVGNYGISQNSSGTYLSGLHLFKNIGTASSPAFQLVDSDYAGISSLFITGPIYPAFGDLDGDGDKDMITGEADGRLQYFHNTGGSPANFVHTGFNYMGIDVGSTSTPQLIDLNHDSILDLVVGAQDGHINYFENIGTAGSPLFSSVPTNGSLGGIVIHTSGSPYGNTVPYFFDDHGQTKLLVGCDGGQVYLYDNIDGNLNGNFHLVDSVIDRTQGFRSGFNLAVSGGDLNNDGYSDMLLGIYGGGVSVYLQRNPNVGIQIHALPEISFIIGPNPADEQCVVQVFNSPASGKNRLNVINYLGQVMFSKMLLSNRLSFSTHEFPSGVYLLQLLSEGNSSTKKLVVKH